LLALKGGVRIETVQHDGLTLGVIGAGAPSRPALMLLHGWPHSKELYDGVVDELATDQFVLAFDLPAIGDSSGAPRSAEKSDLADILLGAAEGLGARAIVVAGLDVGGMIAYAAARDHGHRIVGAVVMNTVLPGLDPWIKILSDPRIWHFAFHKIPELPELMVSGHERAYFDFFTEVLAGRKEAVTERYRETFARAYERPEALKGGFDWYRAMEADAEHNSQYKEIQMPILYLRGDADGRDPDEYVGGIRKAGAKRVESKVLDGSGEFAPLEVPQTFTQAVTSFAAACRVKQKGSGN
jgi:pimeloyl-ACP methyl ester carboxylesterase